MRALRKSLPNPGKMHGEARVDGALAAKGDVTATIPDGVLPGGEEEEK